MDIFADPIEADVTQDGQIPAGALFISVRNEGTTDAVVNGKILRPGKVRPFGFVGKPYRAIDYQTNGNTLAIMRIL